MKATGIQTNFTFFCSGLACSHRWPQCGHSVIIAKKALPTMLRTQRKVWAPLDISLMLDTLPLLKTYCVLPRICSQFNTIIPP